MKLMVRNPYAWFTIFSLGTLFMVFCAIVLVFFWSFWPYTVITFPNANYETTAASYAQGQTGYYTVKYCKYSDPPVVKTKEFVDDIIYALDVAPPTVLPTGCHTTEIPFSIPVSLPPGRYHIQVDAKYRVNPVRVIESIRETNQFQVTAGAGVQ